MKEENQDYNRSLNDIKIRNSNNINNFINNKDLNVQNDNNVKANNGENINSIEFLQHKGFLSNLNSFVNKEN